MICKFTFFPVAEYKHFKISMRQWKYKYFAFYDDPKYDMCMTLFAADHNIENDKPICPKKIRMYFCISAVSNCTQTIAILYLFRVIEIASRLLAELYLNMLLSKDSNIF